MTEPEKLVRIPVRVHGNRLEYFFGGAFPEVLDGAIGDLVLDKESLKNPKDLKRLNEKRQVPILPKGAVLRVLLKPSPFSKERVKKLIERSKDMPLSGGWTHCAEVILNEVLFLEFRGSKQARLTDVKCHVVALNREAKSLNHAYTMLSAFFEKERRSHTGNVFQLVTFYDQGRKLWRTLDELREQLMPLYEERLAPKASTGGLLLGEDGE
jgi:hypothetical protein